MFNYLDKLEFTGTGMNAGIYTFIQEQQGFETPAITVRKGDEVRTVSAGLFKFIRSGAPRYANGDIVQVVFDNKLISAKISQVYASFTNEPNTYSVEFLSDVVADVGVLDDKTFREDYIFPIAVKKTDSSATTLKHINRVAELLNNIAIMLIKRASLHDASKLVSPEKDILDIMVYINQNEGPAPYGSVEYQRRSQFLKPFLDSHYSKNDHHPEYHPNYLNSMNLMQITEMAMDWWAAAERGGETVINLTHSAERFCMSDQVKQIIANTYDALGVKYK